MKIWELVSNDKSRELTTDDQKPLPNTHPFYSWLDGSLLADKWSPCYVVNYRKGKYTDFPGFRSGIPVFSGATFEKIGSYLQSQVEFLPLIHKEMDFIALNVINLVDCADKARSEAKRLISTGDFLGYKKVVFHAEKIPADTLIFKLPETSDSRVYVTDQFVELVKHHKLKGFQFKEVWDSNSECTEELEQEKQKRFQEILNAVQQYQGPKYNYEEAVKQVQNGKAMVSDRWKMQKDTKGRFWLGQLEDNAVYHWLMPTFIPPVLLGYMWHETNLSSI
ncbi:imm11 family protein [Cohnella mopanensis]|uniref:imm11 family protein n=1 Tax=Cohnella mopanensis TaxID=2911966 RepID=UPI001EF76889|nr:DUF1629 domain-containing protein [Cohnella mopanensis]